MTIDLPAPATTALLLPIAVGVLLFLLQFFAGDDHSFPKAMDALSALPSEFCAIAASFEASHVLVTLERPDIPFFRGVVGLIILLLFYWARPHTYGLFRNKHWLLFGCAVVVQLVASGYLVIMSASLVAGVQP